MNYVHFFIIIVANKLIILSLLISIWYQIGTLVTVYY